MALSRSSLPSSSVSALPRFSSSPRRWSLVDLNSSNADMNSANIPFTSPTGIAATLVSRRGSLFLVIDFPLVVDLQPCPTTTLSFRDLFPESSSSPSPHIARVETLTGPRGDRHKVGDEPRIPTISTVSSPPQALQPVRLPHPARRKSAPPPSSER